MTCRQRRKTRERRHPARSPVWAPLERRRPREVRRPNPASECGQSRAAWQRLGARAATPGAAQWNRDKARCAWSPVLNPATAAVALPSRLPRVSRSGEQSSPARRDRGAWRKVAATQILSPRNSHLQVHGRAHSRPRGGHPPLSAATRGPRRVGGGARRPPRRAAGAPSKAARQWRLAAVTPRADLRLAVVECAGMAHGRQVVAVARLVMRISVRGAQRGSCALGAGRVVAL